MTITSTDKLIEGGWIFKSKDLREFPITIKDETGKVQTQILGISRRLPADLDAIQKQADAWLKLMDAGKYGEAWDQSATYYKRFTSKFDTIKLYTQLAAKYGKVTSRKLVSRDFGDYTLESRNFPKGRFVRIKYHADFAKQKDMVQNVLLIPEADGSWKVQSHGLMPRGPIAGAKKGKE